MITNKLAIGSLSLGQHPSHALDLKIRVAAQAGFAGIEIVFSDLERFSHSNNLSLFKGASRIKAICDENHLSILSLAPFENYEGDPSPLADRLQKATQWIEVARVLHAPFLQVPAQYGADAIGDEDVIISELRQLCDLASSKPTLVSVAYEPMSWSTYHSTWESSLKLVESVARENFGLCLDTFHSITKLWADPSAPSGKYPDADDILRESLRRFVRDCPLEKIFFVQLSDGEKFDPPFSKEHPWHLEGEAPQFTWSKHARPFPYEAEFGAYMPVTEVARAWIVETGYTGWVSMEIFDRRMRDKGRQVEHAAMRGMESWRKLKQELEATGPKL
ncbi:3-dehydroshikimate dehydratase [Penicillium subrubescens]|uniref:3-dehydroshikimate dehydratase n=1 Tax=Penicillium subrubescens TaxID=1316194 RepID=A0A1Q5UJY9_9EURO|nr:3-dehydroshikimate dehydratase [Penicillium subrubescens]KAJ5905486.1 3-dehydroshikimate dehydratase [Penicillium subrubescens]OKP12780.1 3-dehydroshikimate dehydratase [Penicillium subrubescens]